MKYTKSYRASKWRRFQTKFVTFYIFTSRKVKTQRRLTKKCVLFMVEMLFNYHQLKKKFRDLVLKILTSKPDVPIIRKFDVIFKIIHENRQISTRDIAKVSNINHTTVLNHLHKAGYTKRLDVWVPHEFSLKNLRLGSAYAKRYRIGTKLTHFPKD